MKISYGVMIVFAIFIIIFAIVGSFKVGIEKFENKDNLTDDEKSFIIELQNTENSEIMKLIKQKNMSKEHIQELISKLTVKTEEPVSQIQEKTLL